MKPVYVVILMGAAAIGGGLVVRYSDHPVQIRAPGLSRLQWLRRRLPRPRTWDRRIPYRFARRLPIRRNLRRKSRPR